MEQRDVWFWLIPFQHGRCSLGAVAKQEFFDAYPFVAEPDRRLDVIAQICAAEHARDGAVA